MRKKKSHLNKDNQKEQEAQQQQQRDSLQLRGRQKQQPQGPRQALRFWENKCGRCRASCPGSRNNSYRKGSTWSEP